MVYARADIYYYAQLSVLRGDADLSFRTENLWVSPLPGEHSGVLSPDTNPILSSGQAISRP